MPGFELFGSLEQKETNKVLETGVLMRYGFDGPRKGQWKAKEMEEALAKRMEVKYAQLLSSGTAALTVALASTEIGLGDEVIVPSFTFVASFEAILSVGAIPVLVDIDDTLTLDPKAVAKAIGPKTKAIMPVHMCGSMANLRALANLCREHNLLLIEDACQAIGGTYEGKPLGSYGDIGCFSFDYVKTITCGEGGALITNNAKYYKHADHYSDHGHDHIGNDRGKEGHPFLGYNFRISELNAAVGVAQLKRLDDFIAIQEKNYSIIRKELEVFPEIKFRTVPEGGVENYSFLSFFLPTQEMAKNVQMALSKAGVDGCFYWYDNNWHYYKKWDHLLDLKSLGKLPMEVQEGVKNQKNNDFAASDNWMGRNLSFLIKLSWKEVEVMERAKKIVEILAQHL